jgi:phage repressor protein C with HTH and peptisase S24 domain
LLAFLILPANINDMATRKNRDKAERADFPLRLWAERLKEARSYFRDTQEAMAARLGVSYRTYQGYETGVAAPKLEIIGRLVELGFNPDWLLRGEAPMRALSPARIDARVDELEREGQLRPLDPGIARIPYYEDARLGAGGGALIEASSTRSVAFDELMLKRDFGVAPRELAVIPVHGNSMEPTIRSGELVLIDMSEAGRALSSAIYAIRLDGALMVKRLEPTGGRRIEVKSDNPLSSSHTLTLDDATDFAIIGRVAVVFRKL